MKAIALALVLLLSSPTVTIKTTPSVMFAPGSVNVTIHISRDAANRYLNWDCAGGDYYSSSVVQLDGDNSPTLFVKQLLYLPAGDYICTARLTQVRVVERATTAFKVVGGS